MKALSVKQPYATWLVTGYKPVETRKWRTKHRGSILICAGKTVDVGISASFLYGVAVGIVDIVDVVSMTDDLWGQACCDFYAGACGWIMENPREIKPFPVIGQLGVFNVDYEEPK